MRAQKSFLEESLKLRPIERAQIVKILMATLEKPDAEIDTIWKNEVIKRYELFKQNKLKAKELKVILSEYE